MDKNLRSFYDEQIMFGVNNAPKFESLTESEKIGLKNTFSFALYDFNLQVRELCTLIKCYTTLKRR